MRLTYLLVRALIKIRSDLCEELWTADSGALLLTIKLTVKYEATNSNEYWFSVSFEILFQSHI